MTTGKVLHNAEKVLFKDIPVFGAEDFSAKVVAMVQNGARISAYFCFSDQVGQKHLVAVLAFDTLGSFEVFLGRVESCFPSVTAHCPQASLFEREIFEEWGIVPEGHPWLKPVRNMGVEHPFFEVKGDEVHEVAVGPVHAGVIEPGHFRFQCHGERVFYLEIMLGYQHRGAEKALKQGPDKRSFHYAETLAGDTSIGHALAYAQNLATFSGGGVPVRAHVIRAVALELERVTNHVGDLGALAGDVGYLPVASFCGRIRGDFLNMTALICGNRFGRNLVTHGGVSHDMDARCVAELAKRLDAGLKDTTQAVELLFRKHSILSRFEETGAVSLEDARTIGLVGPAARACGLDVDVRNKFPTGIYRFFQIPVSTYHTGDVFGRAYVRWFEIQRSIHFIKEQISVLPKGPIEKALPALAPDSLCVAVVEGWRGEICHVALTNDEGRFLSYKVVDPSFHNWFGLSLAMRGREISDFPLINKSFDLSYCGHDL